MLGVENPEEMAIWVKNDGRRWKLRKRALMKYTKPKKKKKDFGFLIFEFNFTGS